MTDYFKSICAVRSAYSIKSKHKKSKGYGFIHLYDEESAQKLLELRTFNINNFNVTVEDYSPSFKNETEKTIKTQELPTNMYNVEAPINTRTTQKTINNYH